MIIPRQYGGLGFSALAHSQVVKKLATRSATACVSVMVPNSLGPAELLLHYGTDEQKNHYLPRLAKGLEMPCFALTGPEAGSDAGVDSGFRHRVQGLHEGREVVGIRSPGKSVTSRSGPSPRCSALRSGFTIPTACSGRRKTSASRWRSYRRDIRA